MWIRWIRIRNTAKKGLKIHVRSCDLVKQIIFGEYENGDEGHVGMERLCTIKNGYESLKKNRLLAKMGLKNHIKNICDLVEQIILGEYENGDEGHVGQVVVRLRRLVQGLQTGNYTKRWVAKLEQWVAQLVQGDWRLSWFREMIG